MHNFPVGCKVFMGDKVIVTTGTSVLHFFCWHVRFLHMNLPVSETEECLGAVGALVLVANISNHLAFSPFCMPCEAGQIEPP